MAAVTAAATSTRAAVWSDASEARASLGPLTARPAAYSASSCTSVPPSATAATRRCGRPPAPARTSTFPVGDRATSGNPMRRQARSRNPSARCGPARRCASSVRRGPWRRPSRKCEGSAAANRSRPTTRNRPSGDLPAATVRYRVRGASRTRTRGFDTSRWGASRFPTREAPVSTANGRVSKAVDLAGPADSRTPEASRAAMALRCTWHGSGVNLRRTFGRSPGRPGVVHLLFTVDIFRCHPHDLQSAFG